MSVMPRGFVLALTLTAAALCGCGPSDGVLSFAFGLALPGAVTFPTADELGAPLDAGAFSHATGRCSGTPSSRKLSLRLEGLPPLGVAPEKAYYRFTLALSDYPMGPQASWQRLLRALSPVGTAWAASGADAIVGELKPDPLGRVNLDVALEDVPLERVVGGRVEIVVPLNATSARTYKVLVGEIGNLQSEGGSAAPAAGGHSH